MNPSAMELSSDTPLWQVIVGLTISAVGLFGIGYGIFVAMVRQRAFTRELDDNLNQLDDQ